MPRPDRPCRTFVPALLAGALICVSARADPPSGPSPQQKLDAIEKALAHTIKGIKGVYNRAEYAEERRRILRLWADFVEAQIDEGRKVILGKFAARP